MNNYYSLFQKHYGLLILSLILKDYMSRIDSVKLAEVNETLRSTLDTNKFLIVTVGADDPWQDKGDSAKE